MTAGSVPPVRAPNPPPTAPPSTSGRGSGPGGDQQSFATTTYSSSTVWMLLIAIAVIFIILAIVALAIGGSSGSVEAAVIIIFGLIIVFALLSHLAYSIQPYEVALVTVLGSYRGFLRPGFNLVSPVAQVVRVDTRTQVLEVPRQEVITKDNSPTNVDAIIYIKVVDGTSAVYRVQDYRLATVALAQTTLRSVIGDMELDEILYNRERINFRLRDILDEATDKWGVRVEAVEIKEVDPVGPVKAAMEEQTSAERQRRAAVLRADGEKRAAILVSEGQKRSRILQAEGLRQSRILEAEGARVATILEAQGEAQRLRILALGAASMDAKAITVLSLDTAAEMANGQATKILFPFELSRLMDGAATYLGANRNVPERALSDIDELQSRFGTFDDVLGPIPKQSELTNEIQSIEQEIKADTEESDAMLNQARGDPSVPKASASPPRTFSATANIHGLPPPPPPGMATSEPPSVPVSAPTPTPKKGKAPDANATPTS